MLTIWEGRSQIVLGSAWTSLTLVIVGQGPAVFGGAGWVVVSIFPPFFFFFSIFSVFDFCSNFTKKCSGSGQKPR